MGVVEEAARGGVVNERREATATFRGILFGLLFAVVLWGLLLALLVAVLWLPQSVGFAIAVVLIFGPLLVWVFRRD